MKCCICTREIESIIHEGKVIWKGGNNAMPLVIPSETEHARCCNACDCLLVLPARMGLVSKQTFALGKQLLDMRLNPPKLKEMVDNE